MQRRVRPVSIVVRETQAYASFQGEVIDPFADGYVAEADAGARHQHDLVVCSGRAYTVETGLAS